MTTTKATLNARVRIVGGPAAGLYGTIAHVDEAKWTADVALDANASDARTRDGAKLARAVPLKLCELIADAPLGDRDKLLERIRKLWAKAESLQAMGPAYEAEAQTFAANAQKMLAKYRLSVADLKLGAAVPRAEPIGGSWTESGGARRSAWNDALASVVARAHFCTLLVNRDGNDSIYFVGRETDRAIAAYIFVTLRRAASELSDAAARKFRREQRRAHGATPREARNYRAAWLLGFVERIAERYRREARAHGATPREARNYRAAWLLGFVERIAERYRREAEEIERAQKSSGGTALVLVASNALAAADGWMRAHVAFGRASAASHRASGVTAHANGRADGRRAADGATIRGTGLGASNATTPRAIGGGGAR